MGKYLPNNLKDANSRWKRALVVLIVVAVATVASGAIFTLSKLVGSEKGRISPGTEDRQKGFTRVFKSILPVSIS